MIGARAMPNHVVCVKWGSKYSSEYVNKLHSMCSRHLTVPYDFHCITENTTGIDPGIDIINLPDLPGIKSWWSKLYMFSNDIKLQGTILFFDLDVVIFKNIDCLFQHQPGTFQIIRDFNRCRVKDWTLCNSSVMRWEAGKLSYLWEDFRHNFTQIMGQNHGDQDYITKRAKQDTTHWPDQWIRSYKWEMIGRKDTKIVQGKKKVFVQPPTIAEENRVAVFHGEPNPHNCGDQFVIDNWR